MSPLAVWAKFQLDWNMHLCFMTENAKCVIKKKKLKQINLNKILLTFISGLAGTICFKFAV